MKIQILCVGKMKDSYNRKLIDSFCEQIRRKNHVIEIKEYPDLKIPDRIRDNQIEPLLEKECEKMISSISDKDYVIALCVEGKEITTKQHKKYLEPFFYEKGTNIIYVIGGSLGLPDKMKKRADLKLSFSKMTFPHQLIRVVLLEELNHILNI
ncbi:MAG: 23S rRNA (pseudouridine(1915)-N(3))-methyltransferase RlmH [Lachnospiraceae bacterium]